MMNKKPELERLTNLRSLLTILLLSVWIKIFPFLKKKKNEAPHSFLVCVHDSSYSFPFPSHSSQRWDCHFLSAQYQSLPHTISPCNSRGLMQQRLCSMHIFQPKALENTYAKSCLNVCTPPLFLFICHQL